MAIFNLSSEALTLLASCIEIGLEGALDEGAPDTAETLAIGALLDELQAIPGCAEITVMPMPEIIDIDQGGPADCAIGLHSWVNHEGKLPADHECTRCGEPYGNPQ